MERCPKCNSENYGYDLDEQGKELWSCLDCKLGIEPDNNREYATQYAYACGYYD